MPDIVDFQSGDLHVRAAAVTGPTPMWELRFYADAGYTTPASDGELTVRLVADLLDTAVTDLRHVADIQRGYTIEPLALAARCDLQADATAALQSALA